MRTGHYLVACPVLNEREEVSDCYTAADLCYAMHQESGAYAYVEDYLGHTYMEYGECVWHFPNWSTPGRCGVWVCIINPWATNPWNSIQTASGHHPLNWQRSVSSGWSRKSNSGRRVSLPDRNGSQNGRQPARVDSSEPGTSATDTDPFIPYNLNTGTAAP